MKKLKLAAMVAGVLLLAGCGCSTQQAQNNQTVPENNQNAESQAPTNNQGGVINSIKDAMGLGKPMKCTYAIKNPSGDLTTTSYVDGKKYMTTTTVAGNVMHTLFDETTMYTWTEGQKQGTKMDIACAQDLAKNVPQGTSTPAPDPTGEKTFDSATNVSCESASGVDFSVPTDITFADQCAALQNILKNIPSDANIPKNMPNIPANVPQLP
jgi:major membrane immunogen (membrane-anchored lipoprotein)